ncbi:MAG: hypothetical protein K2J65_11065 [Duncaniella sp.]|nr:hypothetical protein [Duncaniella sp.]
MAQSSTISITFKLEGDAGGLKKLSVDADGFRKVMGAAVVEAERLKSSIVNFAALATGIDSVNKSLSDLQGVLKELTDAHSAQIEAETKLAVNMRNTMGARQEDIQSIKDLCSTQQELGVIGDEVQLAGAQELATYLSKKQSLEKLIPVMNDMLAQQYGLNATQENAAQIASMLGKVMDGQTGALSRYGYSFDAAQEKILKYGTEAQRAAVLCDVVSSSVGGMNAELAQTDDGKQKQLENTIGDIKEKLGGLVQVAMPFVTIAVEATLAASGVLKLTLACKAFAVASVSGAHKMMAFWRTTTVITSSTTGLTKGIATARLFVSQFCTAVTQGTKGLKLFAMAWKGMLISTGIGLAIAAVTSVIAYLALSTDKATESTNKFLDAEGRAKRDAEQLEQLRQQEVSTLTNTRAALEINISKLKEFNGTKEQEKRLVTEMNDTYGDTMGYFSSVSDWYKALVSNSEAYCRQMVIEARTRMLANQIAEKEQETHDLIYDEAGNKRKYSTKRDVRDVWKSADGWGSYKVSEEVAGTSDWEKANDAVKANTASVANLRKQMHGVAEEAAQIKFSYTGSDKRTDAGGEKTRLQQINDLINKAKENYLTASEAERKGIRQNIQQWDLEKRAIELLQKEAERPVTLESFQDIDDEIAYQQSLRRNASQENLALYDAEIARLLQIKAVREHAAHTPVPIEDIQTYAQLDAEVEYYTWLLQNGKSQERIFAQQHLNDLAKVKKAWGEVLDDIEKPGDISTLNTIKDLDEAISYIDNKIQTASADEIEAYQRAKMAHEDKRKALQRGIEIPSMQREVDEINKLTGCEYKVKISGMGFDELTAKINELDRLLNDTENPLTSSQRKDVENLKQTYEEWRKECVYTFDTLRNGWGSIEGVSSGVETLTDVLEGNGNAWQTVTGIVDGFLQIYDGIKTIVDIINKLSTATIAHTTAKASESAAISVATGAQTAEAVAAEANAVAQIPVIAANKLATASFMELAAAAYFAAHAYIPFAGFGIASGFVTAATAMVQAIGVMPFANGGIVSGPTVGLIGEYAGASSNPEVVAPLDKLRGMLNPVEGFSGGVVKFKIDGRTLVGILEKETNLKNRS